MALNQSSDPGVLKLFLIGDVGVGKTCLILRKAENRFTEQFLSTIGEDFKLATIDGVKVQIWDTAGQERFGKVVTSSSYRHAHGIFIVYDVTNQESFRNVSMWCDEIDRFSSQATSRVLLGNKCDVAIADRHVTTAEGQDLADQMGIPFFETSSKAAVNVDEAFLALVNLIHTQIGPSTPSLPDPLLPSSPPRQDCCHRS